MEIFVIFIICAACFTAGFIIGAGFCAATTVYRTTSDDED